MTEIYMTLNNMNPSIVWEYHEKKYVAYDLRKNNLLKAKTTSYGAESLSFKGSFLSNTLDDNVKQNRHSNVLNTRYKIGPESIATAEYAVNKTGNGTRFHLDFEFYV